MFAISEIHSLSHESRQFPETIKTYNNKKKYAETNVFTKINFFNALCGIRGAECRPLNPEGHKVQRLQDKEAGGWRQRLCGCMVACDRAVMPVYKQEHQEVARMIVTKCLHYNFPMIIIFLPAIF
jgi:hypothetical protein